MSAQMVQVSSHGRCYTLALNTISERLPNATGFARAQYLEKCRDFHLTRCMLINAGSVYFSETPAISIAAQLEERLPNIHEGEDTLNICIAFDDYVYTCEYHTGLVSNERLLSATEIKTSLQRYADALLIPAGALSDVFDSAIRRLPEDTLRLTRSLFFKYRLRHNAYAMLFAGVPSWKHLPIAVCLVCTVTFGGYFASQKQHSAPPPLSVVQYVPKPPPPAYYASTASSHLRLLNRAVAQLHGAARQLEISTLNMSDTSLQVQAANDHITISQDFWDMHTTHTTPKVKPLGSDSAQQLKRTLARLPDASLEHWQMERNPHVTLAQARLALKTGVAWHIAILSALLKNKPAEVTQARVDFDSMGRAHHAELTIKLALRPEKLAG